MSKLRVGVIFGGRSGEHEVSLMSARSVVSALNPQKYEIFLIGITNDGGWVFNDQAARMLGSADLNQPAISSLTVEPDQFPLLPDPNINTRYFDVIFPVLHGPHGEDGTIQGMLELADLPYVGAGVLGSAVAMDKGLMRTVLAQAGLPLLKWETVIRSRWEADPEPILALIETEIDYPCFVKPANLGSSVGITKAANRQQLTASINYACEFDRRVVVEQALTAPREIECSVLGNDDPEASILGEIVPVSEFNDYEEKYINNKSPLIIPADLTADQEQAIRDYAVKTFKAVDCAGMARVDFFVTAEGQIYVNEINTIPGFTQISMYPKLWEASGLQYSDLLDRLIELALERHQDKRRRRISINS